MAWTLTIQSASSAGNKLAMTYSRNGDLGGHGVEWPSDRAADFEINEAELEDFICRMVLTLARRRGLTAAQLVGKVITVDPAANRNLIFFV